MRRLPLFIDQTGALFIAQLAARARRLKRQRGLHLIVVDYIQLMQGRSQRATQNRVQEIAEITTGLKALAKELYVPVVAMSQLSRGSKTATKNARNFPICASQARSNKTPTSSCSSIAKSIISRTKSRSPGPTTTSPGNPR